MANQNQDPKPSKGSEEGEIEIHFDQSPSHQTYHVDGARGGMAPQGDKLVFDFYTERSTYPQLIRHKLNEDGSLGEKIAQGGREGVLREGQCTIVMDWKTAIQLLQWLEDEVEKARDAGIIKKKEVNDEQS